MSRKSVTLVEVIVAAVILALSFGGVITAFVGARSYVTYSNERIVAANLARRALEDLYEHVSADTWDTGQLSIHNGAVPDYSIDDQTYGGNPPNDFRVSNVPSHQYREVQVDINYTSSAGRMGGGGGGNANH